MSLYEGEYCTRMIGLPGDINSVVRLSDDDFPNIYINDWLSPPARRRHFKHEMEHLERDDFYNDLPIEEIES